MKREVGYTLIELLVAIGIGAVIIYGVTTTFVGSTRTSGAAIRTGQFEQEMRATMSLMVNDIKRAGYSSKAADDVGSGTNTNAFSIEITGSTSEPMQIWATNTGTTVRAITGNPIDTATGTCITYSYDYLDDGALSPGTKDFRGFRYNSTDQAIEKKTSGGTAGQSRSPSCNTGSWEQITSSDMKVTSLTFNWVDYTSSSTPTVSPTPASSPTAASCPGLPTAGDNTAVVGRVVRITMVAKAVVDKSADYNSAPLQRTLIEDVKVGNNILNVCGS